MSEDARLTHRERQLLAVLERHAGQTVSRRALVVEVWESEYIGPRSVDVLVSKLRKRGYRIEATHSAWNANNGGYRLVDGLDTCPTCQGAGRIRRAG